MSDLATTRQYIADILSFKSSDSQLESALKHPEFDWDNIVVVGSKHLVLPAIYCRLKSKKLLHTLPEELLVYLKEITAINRNRNASIIQQAIKISNLLKDHNINHVFLKGTALLATNFYADNAERMVGDIDILVAEDELYSANDLIKSIGYKEAETTLSVDFFEHRHLPRLLPTEDICAIELHHKLLTNFKDKQLETEVVLNEKNINAVINVPSRTHILLHNILNHQINDNGELYKIFAMRPAYDTLILLEQYDFSHLIKKLKHNPYKNYLVLINYYFLLPQYLDIKASYSKYDMILKHSFLRKLYIKGVKMYMVFKELSNRLKLFVFNSAYRKAILNDKRRVIILLKDKLLLKK